MRRTGRIVLLGLIAAAAVAAMVVLAISLLDDEKRQNQLEVVESRDIDDRLVELTLKTPALATDTHVRVLLPRGYEDSDRSYPVLYLLHGAGVDYRWWTDFGQAGQLTEDLPLIVVMPDGGGGGFYSNWLNGGKGGPPEWETYHVDQLIPLIDERFRTIDDRGGRAIAGSSMGGFGALSYAARHPDTFELAVSFSGLVDSGSPGFLPVLTSASRASPGRFPIWGDPRDDAEVWQEHNPLDLAPELKGTRVLLFTGNGQPGGPLGGSPDTLEAAVEQMNMKLASRLDELGIQYRLVDYGAGAHLPEYFQQDLRSAMPEIMGSFPEQ